MFQRNCQGQDLFARPGFAVFLFIGLISVVLCSPDLGPGRPLQPPEGLPSAILDLDTALAQRPTQSPDRFDATAIPLCQYL